VICEFCQCEHDNEGDRYGCPNCCGGEFDVTPAPKAPLTPAQRQKRRRALKAAKGLVKVEVWVPSRKVAQIKQLESHWSKVSK
jgi:hypothetical protein